MNFSQYKLFSSFMAVLLLMLSINVTNVTAQRNETNLTQQTISSEAFIKYHVWDEVLGKFVFRKDSVGSIKSDLVNKTSNQSNINGDKEWYGTQSILSNTDNWRRNLRIVNDNWTGFYFDLYGKNRVDLSALWKLDGTNGGQFSIQSTLDTTNLYANVKSMGDNLQDYAFFHFLPNIQNPNNYTFPYPNMTDAAKEIKILSVGNGEGGDLLDVWYDRTKIYNKLYTDKIESSGQIRGNAANGGVISWDKPKNSGWHFSTTELSGGTATYAYITSSQDVQNYSPVAHVYNHREVIQTTNDKAYTGFYNFFTGSDWSENTTHYKAEKPHFGFYSLQTGGEFLEMYNDSIDIYIDAVFEENLQVKGRLSATEIDLPQLSYVPSNSTDLQAEATTASVGAEWLLFDSGSWYKVLKVETNKLVRLGYAEW